MISHQQSKEIDLDTIGLEMVKILRELRKDKDDQLDSNFFQGDNVNQNKFKKKVRISKYKTKYSKIKVKARNFLTNTYYRGYEHKDFKNEAFVADIYSFLLQNLNPIMVERKFDNENDWNYVRMLWHKCIPQEFCRYIYLNNNYLIPNSTLNYFSEGKYYS